MELLRSNPFQGKKSVIFLIISISRISDYI